jgi:transcriptional regulator with XRE-family HTH domain
MISPAMVLEVRRLLAEGKLSQRKIARQTGISRATISLIAQGRRPDYTPKPRAWDEDWEPPLGPPRRCPQCGGLVYLPCRLCRVRAIKERDLKRARARRLDAARAAGVARPGAPRPGAAPCLAWPGRDSTSRLDSVADRRRPESRSAAPAMAGPHATSAASRLRLGAPLLACPAVPRTYDDGDPKN